MRRSVREKIKPLNEREGEQQTMSIFDALKGEIRILFGPFLLNSSRKYTTEESVSLCVWTVNWNQLNIFVAKVKIYEKFCARNIFASFDKHRIWHESLLRERIRIPFKYGRRCNTRRTFYQFASWMKERNSLINSCWLFVVLVFFLLFALLFLVSGMKGWWFHPLLLKEKL